MNAPMLKPIILLSFCWLDEEDDESDVESEGFEVLWPVCLGRVLVVRELAGTGEV